ncbi:hypothetical protein [Geodermatophilus obscurus]|uniref:Uncharacterized protein n=1 Tax=Geodermatophilus obscurus (strain ATCC 25078 / DSM 43160 / JCM 3152 / CCUG 61914 / KCC A-0152 / KCTC 9177 / NBRC 13315 / NRRL B-3577 / G-20) TaxID=526225 RepID=D2SHD6_GEOOG|nr:hypothetical protein [Geodermatophilus obscurus]ADB77090.1 conserved hypothetical protein [Geodermatophilus obscurus DSM 43160]
MNRSRLLLALSAATALVLAGGSPAWAGGDGHDHGEDAWAKVIEINDEAELEDDGDVLQVTFEYKCEDDDEKVTADVKAEDGDISYEADDAELDCNGEKNEITVDLEKRDDAAEKGDKVDVTVTINEGDEELDEETKEDVEVVDEENGGKDGADKDNGGDKDNGDH